MSAPVLDWIRQGLAAGFGLADHARTPKPRPTLPQHVETFTVDPPKVATPPVVIAVATRAEAVEAFGEASPAVEAFDLIAVPEEPALFVPLPEPRPDALPPLVARLVTCEGDREDLLKDQALPPCYAVVERKGRAVARFHGAEHAAKLARILSPKHAVVRIADLELMTDVQVPKGWRP